MGSTNLHNNYPRGSSLFATHSISSPAEPLQIVTTIAVTYAHVFLIISVDARSHVQSTTATLMLVVSGLLSPCDSTAFSSTIS